MIPASDVNDPRGGLLFSHRQRVCIAILFLVNSCVEPCECNGSSIANGHNSNFTTMEPTDFADHELQNNESVVDANPDEFRGTSRFCFKTRTLIDLVSCLIENGTEI